MSSFQWFCLSLRIIGVWTLVSGLEMLGSAYNVAHGHSGSGYDAWAFVNQTVFHVVIAALLIGLAPALARMVYRQPERKPAAETEENGL
ncbi:hypothetical protein [Dyella terrae]|uniref:hypothetical protein n=1 Tax=Dyella terrae TaxID=522259 RepID=UPI001EFE68AB|nr:hypothetical protein [Dyella terrae]ULU25149.1 hypothetical protein DYST_02072 [Dyella terrae]